MAATVDPVEHIPPPEEVRQLLAESIRRTDLLRSLLRVSRRKAAYRSPKAKANLISEAAARGFKLITADQLLNTGEAASHA